MATSTTLDLDALDPRLPRVESALHGPAHPDEFRVKVGRWGERWYHDPLPACPLAEACTDAWPSVTTIKKASDRDWSWVSLERAAHYLADRRAELDGLNAAEIHARLLEVNKAGLNRAASRGTSIHHVMEALAAGGALPALSPEAEPYLPACRKFLDDAQPDWLLSEVVAISRSCGYGGTFDAVIRIDGKTYLVDWKTRKPGKHGAYPEEAWQLAAYANADYIIVDQDGQAARQRMPHLDGAYVVSLAPEGYRLYPVDLDEAWESYKTLRLFWDRKRADHIGKPVRLQPLNQTAQMKVSNDQTFISSPSAPLGPTPEEDERWAQETLRVDLMRNWIVARLDVVRGNPETVRAMTAAWPDGVPGLKTDHRHTVAELEQIAAALDTVEATFGIPFGDTDPRAAKPAVVEPAVPVARPALPDEGSDVDPAVVAEIIKRIDALPEATRKQLNTWAGEAHKAGRAFSIKVKPSTRRYAIYEACLELVDLDDDDLVRASLSTTADAAAVAEMPIGAAIGNLTTAEAVWLIDIVKEAKRGNLALCYYSDGAVRWEPINSNTTEKDDSTS